MKDMFTNMIDCLKNTKISKHYDSETKLECGGCKGEPLSITMKGDFTVNAIQVIAAFAVVSAMCVSAAVIKKLKK